MNVQFSGLFARHRLFILMQGPDVSSMFAGLQLASSEYEVYSRRCNNSDAVTSETTPHSLKRPITGVGKTSGSCINSLFLNHMQQN